MRPLFNFIFNNSILVLILGALYFIYRQYKGLKDIDREIKTEFNKILNRYLDGKIIEAGKIAAETEKEYGHVDLIQQEIERLKYSIEKGINGTINDKVETSNLLNKFKLNKKIDREKYPNLDALENLGTFTEEEMASVDNGLAITRKQYNTLAFKYNEKGNEFPIEYLKKFFKLVNQYSIFDAPKTSHYEEEFEVFEEKEPEINSLSSLNRVEEIELPKEVEEPAEEVEVTIEHSDAVFKPKTTVVDNQANSEKGN